MNARAGEPRGVGTMRKVVTTALLIAALSPGTPARASAPDVYRVGPGDVVQVTVYAGGEKQDDYSATITAGGTMVCPLLGELALGGLTVPEITGRIRDGLARDYFVNPQVLVTVKTVAGSVLVLGEVKQPGIYPLREGLTVLAACTLAGGFTDFASPRAAKVTRTVDGKLMQLRVDLALIRQGKRDDLPLANGDRVEVPRRWF